jgi:hypothetical protein
MKNINLNTNKTENRESNNLFTFNQNRKSNIIIIIINNYNNPELINLVRKIAKERERERDMCNVCSIEKNKFLFIKKTTV